MFSQPTPPQDCQPSPYYRDCRTDFHGDYEDIGSRDLTTGPYLLHRAQVLIQMPPETLPRTADVPTRGIGCWIRRWSA